MREADIRLQLLGHPRGGGTARLRANDNIAFPLIKRACETLCRGLPALANFGQDALDGHAHLRLAAIGRAARRLQVNRHCPLTLSPHIRPFQGTSLRSMKRIRISKA
jgi:hypothetical protein